MSRSVLAKTSLSVTIPEERRDRTLAAMLMTGRDGILGWMLAGCAEWRRRGLAPPGSIRAAAEDYFAAEDLVGQWIEEVCCSGPDQRATARAFFASWSAWASAGGNPAGTQRALGEALRSRGLTSGKVGGARSWMGIAVRKAERSWRDQIQPESPVGASRLEAAE